MLAAIPIDKDFWITIVQSGILLGHLSHAVCVLLTS